MKKRMLLIATCIIVIFVFTGCKKNEEKQKENNNKQENNNVLVTEPPLNDLYNIDETMMQLKDETMTTLEKSEIAQKYELGDKSNLEMQVLIDSSESNYEEIAMIKITNETQIYEIQKMMLDRVEALKTEHKDNNSIMKVLNNSENIMIKIQDGVGILVISTNASEIMATIDSTFYNM